MVVGAVPEVLPAQGPPPRVSDQELPADAVARAQAEAMRRYPAIGVKGSPENQLFLQRFRELTEGRIAILISHRFSTVRMADRIVVIEDGQLTELGTHAELLALNGTYARLFNMQAEGYR